MLTYSSDALRYVYGYILSPNTSVDAFKVRSTSPSTFSGGFEPNLWARSMPQQFYRQLLNPIPFVPNWHAGDELSVVQFLSSGGLGESGMGAAPQRCLFSASDGWKGLREETFGRKSVS